MSAQTPPQRDSENISIGGWVARAIAVVIFLPLRLLWEGCKLLGRVVLTALQYILDHLLVPIGRFVRRWIVRPAIVFVKDYLWGLLIQQLLWGAILTPLGALLLDFVLRPLKNAVEQWIWRRALRPALVWLGTRVIAPAARWIDRRILRPVGRAVAAITWFLVKWLIIAPAVAIWRWIVLPIVRVFGAALAFGWRVATIVVGVLVVAPCRFLYRTVLRPLFAAIATAWRATVVRPLGWLYAKVVRPMNKAVGDIMSAVFGR
ncbi:hypothetical protein ABZ319_18895 [Nocardia sp. NPDC005978]|uniref:hypothetical protein n=1 Tax=Nocardia sp. NPDC005978 TaxID=3156725 RepID=UPI0033A6AE1B